MVKSFIMQNSRKRETMKLNTKRSSFDNRCLCGAHSPIRPGAQESLTNATGKDEHLKIKGDCHDLVCCNFISAKIF